MLKQLILASVAGLLMFVVAGAFTSNKYLLKAGEPVSWWAPWFSVILSVWVFCYFYYYVLKGKKQAEKREKESLDKLKDTDSKIHALNVSIDELLEKVSK